MVSSVSSINTLDLSIHLVYIIFSSIRQYFTQKFVYILSHQKNCFFFKKIILFLVFGDFFIKAKSVKAVSPLLRFLLDNFFLFAVPCVSPYIVCNFLPSISKNLWTQFLNVFRHFRPRDFCRKFSLLKYFTDATLFPDV